MHPHATLALLESAVNPLVDDLLRILGVAVIVWIFFRGVKSLISKPIMPPPQAAATPQTAEVITARAAGGGAAQAAGDIPPEIIAVIAAAVATAAGPASRVVSIKSYSNHWERAGRLSILTSHRIR